MSDKTKATTITAQNKSFFYLVDSHDPPLPLRQPWSSPHPFQGLTPSILWIHPPPTQGTVQKGLQPGVRLRIPLLLEGVEVEHHHVPCR